MQSSTPPTPHPLPHRNTFAALSLVGAALAWLGNCLNLAGMLIPGVGYVCAVINAAFSLGAVATGSLALAQIRRSPVGQTGRGLAIGGLVMGILGLLAACLIPLLGTAVLAALGLEIGDLLLVPVK